MTGIARAADWLREHDHYLIMTHRRPDGDAAGSAAALCRGLRSMGKSAELFPNPQFTEKFAPLLEGLLGSGDPTGKTVISVDLAAESMLPYNAPGMAEKIVFAIDHHGSNTGYARDSLVLPEMASCGEIIWDVLQELGTEIDKTTAEAVYVALSTDTGCFRFTNTNAHTLKTAAACLEAGADIHTWNRVLFLTKTAPRLRLEAYLSQNMEFYMEGKIALCLLPQSVVNECGAREDDMDDISGFPRDIEGVEAGVLIRDVADGAKVSLRTYEPWNASEICALLGGGGHAAAAGATVKGTLEDGKTAVLQALRQFGAEV